MVENFTRPFEQSRSRGRRARREAKACAKGSGWHCTDSLGIGTTRRGLRLLAAIAPPANGRAKASNGSLA